LAREDFSSPSPTLKGAFHAMKNPARTGISHSSFQPLARPASLLLLFVALCLSVGCSGQKGGAKNEVSGKVTLGDKPVTGIVGFVYSDNSEVTAPTDPDGKYTIANAKEGAVKVYVKPVTDSGASVGAPIVQKGAADMPKEGPGGATGARTPPLPKYSSVNTSGLTYDVKAGKQTYDIPLKP
jgi:hypothetical protein